MDSIFHEKQQGSLCAQHCLNALLQGPFFTPVDLATLAQRMDDEERIRMAESGVDSEEYRRFLEQPSGNMDDSGYFSVQVISSALEVWGLELVPFNSSEPLSREANAHPETMSAYICNYRDHWFTIRKLGFQWFNLNSILSKPELVSNTYLTIFLAQLQQEGYSIFIVTGNLPHCTADELLKLNPAVPSQRSSIKKEVVKSQQDLELEKAIKLSLGQPEDKDEEDFQAALQLSLEENKDPSLDRAIKLSLQADSCNGTGANPPPCQEEESNNHLVSASASRSDNADDELQEAINLSLEGLSEPGPRIVNIPITIEGQEAPDRARAPSNTPISLEGPPVDIEEIRRRRLAYMENKTATG